MIENDFLKHRHSMKKFFVLIVLLMMFCCNFPAFAFNWDGEIDLTTGYRNDQIKTLINAFNPPETPIIQDIIKANNIDIFLIGLKGRATLCDDWFIRGFADFGFVTNGKSSPNITRAIAGWRH